MPWQEASVMDQRREFVRFAMQKGANRRELCRRFGISSDVAYKWIRRWTRGDEELADRSRRPHGSPGRSEAMMEQRVLAVRDAHPAWGARKIARRLEDDGIMPPALSTVAGQPTENPRTSPWDPDLVIKDKRSKGQATMKPLTDAVVRSARAPVAGRIELRDLACRGLAIRITANDVRSWTFRFKDRLGRDGRVALGRYPDVSLAAARARADELRRQVAAGVNPTAARRQERAEADSKTFEHLAGRYMAEHAWRHKRPASAAADKRNLRKHVLPKWGRRPYTEITRADVIELVEGLIMAGKDTLANRVGALISKVFSFGVDAGVLTTHPAIRLGKRGVETQGTRVLSDDELRLFWNKIVEPPVSRSAGLALRLQLVAALRPSEAAGLRCGELQNFQSKTDAAILLPGERTKNGREHWLPLCPLAREIVAEALTLAPKDSGAVFPSPQVEGAGIEGHSLATAMRRFAEALGGQSPGVKTWRADPPSPHDLRRTCRTRLSALGVPREHCDAIMNHAPQDVGRRHYDRHAYQGEMRVALETWGRALAAILEGKRKGSADVVPIRGGRRVR